MLTVLAAAKVNLTLEVLAERADGFHEIRSVAQTISLCDKLRFQVSDRLEFYSAYPGWIPGESLVLKAADLLRERTGCSQGATVTLDRRIPLLSGLGGDSSDAAAVLRGLNQLWELSLPQKELIGLAAELGSDVTFFLYGGTALLEGRGEVVTSLSALPYMWVILMLPSVSGGPGKTGRLYASIRDEHYTGGQATGRMVQKIEEGGEVAASMVFNVFDWVARDCFEGLGVYWEQFLESGAPSVHLAGSGPVLFTMLNKEAEAEAVCQSLRQRNLDSYLAHTVPAVDNI